MVCCESREFQKIMFLKDDVFRKVIESTPLVSIDLIVRNVSGQVLLGERNNSPAKGYWFVPGGRIYKNEKIADALQRISINEIGYPLSLENCTLKGVYEHFYDDGFYGESDSTHYLALGFETSLSVEKLSLPFLQHNSYRFFSELELSKSSEVHRFTKEYF